MAVRGQLSSWLFLSLLPLFSQAVTGISCFPGNLCVYTSVHPSERKTKHAVHPSTSSTLLLSHEDDRGEENHRAAPGEGRGRPPRRAAAAATFTRPAQTWRTRYRPKLPESNKRTITRHQRRGGRGGGGVDRVRDRERKSQASRQRLPELRSGVVLSSCFQKLLLRLCSRCWPGSEAASPALCRPDVHSRR